MVGKRVSHGASCYVFGAGLQIGWVEGGMDGWVRVRVVWFRSLEGLCFVQLVRPAAVAMS